MRVLVTRPPDDARDTAALLAARGHEAIVAPLLGVRYHDGHALHLDDVRALLFTSANGVRALARRTSLRDFPVFAVGSQTAEAAREAGFRDVRNAGGNVETLADAVRGAIEPKQQGVLLHAAGAEAEGRLAALLSAAGYKVRTEVLYDVPVVAELPAAARDGLAAGAVDAVLLFSARSAQVFADSVKRAGLAPACAGLVAACISEAAAGPLAGLAFREIRIAPRPNQAALLECLD
ncbi:MAG TPA: uroporphyrinogen-III synthase [Rhizomicrobium sp.]|nr:uroporphyrinogen-III synthase [Rhizomicrobium sp.]